MIISAQLEANCRKRPERTAWLSRLPALLDEFAQRWSLRIGPPFSHACVTCSWVAPVIRADGSPATLKLAMPHMEGEHEIAGLRYWNGNPTVMLLAADDERGAMLLEQCCPGTTLNEIPEPDQDRAIAALARRLWRSDPPANAPATFRPLSALLGLWRTETLEQRPFWPDEGLVNQGLALFQELSAPAERDTLLSTDLHAGNVLRAEREPWLVVDPKPFFGDPV